MEYYRGEKYKELLYIVGALFTYYAHLVLVGTGKNMDIFGERKVIERDIQGRNVSACRYSGMFEPEEGK